MTVGPGWSQGLGGRGVGEVRGKSRRREGACEDDWMVGEAARVVGDPADDGRVGVARGCLAGVYEDGGGMVRGWSVEVVDADEGTLGAGLGGRRHQICRDA